MSVSIVARVIERELDQKLSSAAFLLPRCVFIHLIIEISPTLCAKTATKQCREQQKKKKQKCSDDFSLAQKHRKYFNNSRFFFFSFFFPAAVLFPQFFPIPFLLLPFWRQLAASYGHAGLNERSAEVNQVMRAEQKRKKKKIRLVFRGRVGERATRRIGYAHERSSVTASLRRERISQTSQLVFLQPEERGMWSRLEDRDTFCV